MRGVSSDAHVHVADSMGHFMILNIIALDNMLSYTKVWGALLHEDIHQRLMVNGKGGEHIMYVTREGGFEKGLMTWLAHKEKVAEVCTIDKLKNTTKVE